MTNRYLLILSFLCFSLWTQAQNLIPDSDFESFRTGACLRPFEGIDVSNFWYDAAGTVDWYKANCPQALPGGVSTPNPWPFADYPTTGSSFVGLWGSTRTDNRLVSEVVGTPLTTPLNNNQYYLIQLETRFRGVWHPEPDFAPLNCVTDPPRAIEVYITENNDFNPTTDQNAAAEALEGRKVLSFSSAATTENNPTLEWTSFQGCFQAQGNEKQLAIGTSIGAITPMPPCDFNPPGETTYSLHYFNIDNVRLYPFPLPQQDTFLLCEETSRVFLDVKTYFDPQTIDAVDLQWQDGFEGWERTFTAPGRYTANAVLECGTIPFVFTLLQKSCEPAPYVPTAFSPNGDGINDEFYPFFDSDFPIENYHFQVFDRWGGRVFSSKERGFSGAWQGDKKGKDANSGIYTWLISFDFVLPDGKKTYTLTGDVVLIR